jgi:release factor glutamine methyltransferase
MNVSSWLKKATKTIDRLDAELILAYVLRVERTFLHAHPDYKLIEDEQKQADHLLERRANYEPFAYLSGRKEFYGRIFAVTRDTLIPRPETEALIDAIKPLKPAKILDVGTGTGCIAVTLALELPDSTVEAVDISKGALDIARKNAERLQANVNFYYSDLLQETGKYDLIVANLPYVDRDWDWLSPELAFEPDSALYADDGGLEYIKALIEQAGEHLNEGGHLVLEADHSQHQKISDFARDFQFETIIPNDEVQKSALSLVLALRSAE